MGSSASSVPNFYVSIQTKVGPKFRISYADLMDHILLLRKVIANPEMTKKGSILNDFIQDYCKRMAAQTMIHKYQQLQLPWQTEWIWHVHRLHPITYCNDCAKQLPAGRIVDKKAYNLIKNHNKISSEGMLTSTNTGFSFIPSIDLTEAVIRQRDFLEKFKQHHLYVLTFTNNDHSEYFEQLVQNYVSFMKLARKNEIIVPTFDIDVIWHTHMRRPLDYYNASIDLCGFVLDHNDSIDKNVLSTNYQETADRWKATYNTDYGQNINRKKLETSGCSGSCAMVYKSTFFSDSGDGGDVCGGGGDCGGGCGGD